MKRFIALIIIALSLCSCGKADGEVSYDCDIEFQQYNAVKISSDGETLFFVPDISQKIWYYDKNAEISGILCGKPECSHSGEDCNAFFDGVELGFYGGRLYGLKIIHASDCKVFSSAPDGSGRKTELDLSDTEFANMLSDAVENLRGMFHRGFFYACGTHNTVSDGIMQSCAQVFSYSLDSGKGGAIYESSELLDVEIFPYGDYLYFLASDESNLEIYRYSPADGTSETLYHGASEIESPKLWIKSTSDGEEIYVGDKGESAEIYKLDLGKNALTPCFALENPYLIYGFSDDFVIGGNMEGISCLLCLTDYSGNTVLETRFTPPGISEGELLFTFPCGSDGENIYLWSKVWSAEHDVQFLSAVSQKSGKSKVLWTNGGGGSDGT